MNHSLARWITSNDDLCIKTKNIAIVNLRISVIHLNAYLAIGSHPEQIVWYTFVMPSRNVTKQYVADSFYHVYNRGVNKQNIFLDDQDYTVFLGLMKRYLSRDVEKMPNRLKYVSYVEQVELLTYCLMPNHFHLLLYQIDKEGMKLLLKSVSVSYSMYFNKKYRRVGALFQQRYRAVRMESDSQLLHASRYIHLNPKDFRQWKWSSIGYYIGDKSADWVKPERVLDQHSSTEAYTAFVEDYIDRKDELKLLKDELAG